VSNTSRRGPSWWRRFRALRPWVQIVSWIGLALVVLIIIGGVFGEEVESDNTATTTATTTPPETPAQTQTPTTTPPETPTQTQTPTPTPTPTTTAPQSPSPSPTQTTISLAKWRSKHGGDIALVIATAHGLVRALGGSNEIQLSKSCDALKNNYRRLLQPIPDPPGRLGESLGTWDSAKDSIYYAQRKCSGGFIRRADLYEAEREARNGIALLNKVLG
jgi:hypothetical protein